MSNLEEHVIREREQETLQTFRSERPSEYFSHLADPEAFVAHDRKIERLYRFGLTLPPEFFQGKKVVDFGGGTGENTVSLSRWGATITLVDLNPDAVKIARQVYEEHGGGNRDHKFLVGSIYDEQFADFRESFDVSLSRGLLMHVADKRKAFSVVAGAAKPGGYIVYGDRNQAGGVQEMLQRLAIYHFAGDDPARIVAVAEELFSDDITRSQKSVPRTREAIIYDRWVIQQQDDPSIEEVLSMFEDEGIEYVSSWPRIDFVGRGESSFSDPENISALKASSPIVESLWMLLNKGEEENLASTTPNTFDEFAKPLEDFSGNLRNLRADSVPAIAEIRSNVTNLAKVSSEILRNPVRLLDRLDIFLREVGLFLSVLENANEPSELKDPIQSSTILFRGYAGVRHVDYVGYKGPE